MRIGLFGGNKSVNELLVKKDKLMYQDKKFILNDLFTEELYKYSNNNVQKYVSDVCKICKRCLYCQRSVLKSRTAYYSTHALYRKESNQIYQNGRNRCLFISNTGGCGETV